MPERFEPIVDHYDMPAIADREQGTIAGFVTGATRDGALEELRAASEFADVYAWRPAPEGEL